MILYLGNKLSKHGKSVSVIETLSSKLARRYSIVSVSDKKNIVLRFIDMAWHLVKYRKKTKIILVDTYSSWAFYYVVLVAFFSRLYKYPYVPIVHGGNLKKRLRSSPYLSRFVFSKAYCIVSPSYYLQKVFSDSGYRTIYIPNSLDMGIIKFTLRKKVKPKLLWVRSFLTQYRPEAAVEVMRELVKVYPDAELCMVGGGDKQIIEGIKRLIGKYKLHEHIKLMGKLTQSEWYELSEEYDIFINTTSVDNHPVSIIEAMALGMPIISTKVGGLPYLIENGVDGILVTPNEDLSMVEAIKTLVNNNAMVEELSVSARKKAISFDWRFVAPKWYALLDPIAGLKGKV